MKNEYSAHPALASEQLQRAAENALAQQQSTTNKNPLLLLAKHRRHRLSEHAVASSNSKLSQSNNSANTIAALNSMAFANTKKPFIAFADADDADADEAEADDELAFGDDDDDEADNTTLEISQTKDCVDFAPSAPPIDLNIVEPPDQLQQRLSRIQHISEQYCQRQPYQRRDLSHHREAYIATMPETLAASSECSLSVCSTSSAISTPSASTVSSPLSTPTHYVAPQQLQHSHSHCCQHGKISNKATDNNATATTTTKCTAATCTAQQQKQHEQQQQQQHQQQKTATAAAAIPAVAVTSSSGCKKSQKFDPSFGSSPYRQLFPIVLCVLSFATVFSLLIIYMDTTEIRHQQFRLNMSRDYDFNSVAQDDPTLVAFLREIQMRKYSMHFLKNGNTPLVAPMVTAAAGGNSNAPVEQHLNFSAHSGELTPQMAHYVANLVGGKMNGAVIQSLPGQLGRLMTAPWLVETLNWAGLIVEPEPRRFFTLRKQNALRTRLQVVHACVSPNPYPKEVTIHNEEAEVRINSLLDEETSWFNSRVKCFPLYTIMLAYERVEYDLLSLGVQHGHELEILQTLPFDKIRIEVISIHLPEDRDEPHGYIPSITKFLIGKSYKMQKKFGHNYFYQRLNVTTTTTMIKTTTKITELPTIITTTIATRTRKKDILLLKTP